MCIQYIQYSYVYMISIHKSLFLNSMGGGLFKQPNRYIDLFERLREARTYIEFLYTLNKYWYKYLVILNKCYIFVILKILIYG